ncbi:MAG: hypothetical protein P4L92_12905, partial [Rudaea sp.]|nr:hypothetical protein [Rudaea sp.]
MSAFGRKAGTGGGSAAMRPSFGVARPMKGNDSAAPLSPAAGAVPVPGNDGRSFEPVDANGRNSDALARLADRANQVVENHHHAEGFEASVHKIKEQVLPHLL